MYVEVLSPRAFLYVACYALIFVTVSPDVDMLVLEMLSAANFPISELVGDRGRELVVMNYAYNVRSRVVKML